MIEKDRGKPAAIKVLVYATWGERLLVFDEPDFPHIALQVPGGTVEPNEDIADAAIREFGEETGLTPTSPFLRLATQQYRYKKNDRIILHERHYFHLELTDSYPETWTHMEMSPYDGSPPILFRFSWMPIAAAQAQLGCGMGEMLEYLPS